MTLPEGTSKGGLICWPRINEIFCLGRLQFVFKVIKKGKRDSKCSTTSVSFRFLVLSFPKILILQHSSWSTESPKDIPLARKPLSFSFRNLSGLSETVLCDVTRLLWILAPFEMIEEKWNSALLKQEENCSLLEAPFFLEKRPTFPFFSAESLKEFCNN